MSVFAFRAGEVVQIDLTFVRCFNCLVSDAEWFGAANCAWCIIHNLPKLPQRFMAVLFHFDLPTTFKFSPCVLGWNHFLAKMLHLGCETSKLCVCVLLLYTSYWCNSYISNNVAEEESAEQGYVWQVGMDASSYSAKMFECMAMLWKI